MGDDDSLVEKVFTDPAISRLAKLFWAIAAAGGILVIGAGTTYKTVHDTAELSERNASQIQILAQTQAVHEQQNQQHQSTAQRDLDRLEAMIDRLSVLVTDLLRQ